jgi:hypothetical protein
MSDSQNKKTQQMDPRCPRKLECHPDSWCPLAVLRLKALRNAGAELSEEEESKMPGCPWAVNHQLANYCFFKYASDFLDPDNTPSDSEIAHFNNVSQDTVKKTIKKAISKGKEVTGIKELINSPDGSSVFSDNDGDSSYSVIK